jgi:hypothetical protein
MQNVTRPDMNRLKAIRFGIWIASLSAALAINLGMALAESGSAGGDIGNDDKSISGSRPEPSAERERSAHRSREVEEPRRPSRASGGGGGNFDGAWSYTGVGTNCQGSGSGAVVIAGGRVTAAGVNGQVSSSGAYHVVAVGNDGVVLTAVGHLSASSGSGTFKRSDGCIGRWAAVRQ